MPHRWMHREREPSAAVPVRPLADLAAGTAGTVHRLLGGRLFACRLAALGVSTGVKMTVLRNSRRGPLAVMVRGTRIALGRGEASKVLVEVGSDAAGAPYGG
jgi:ferrous iron transport protein A